MKIVLDQGVDDRIKNGLTGHEVRFSRHMQWAELSNGTLLSAAEDAGFELMITTDKNIRYQQNLSKCRISIIVPGSNYWPETERHLAAISDAVNSAVANSFQEIPMLSRKEFLRRAGSEIE